MWGLCRAGHRDRVEWYGGGGLHRIGVQTAVQGGMGAVWGGCIGWPGGGVMQSGMQEAHRAAKRMVWGGGLCRVVRRGCTGWHAGAACGHGGEGGTAQSGTERLDGVVERLHRRARRRGGGGAYGVARGGRTGWHTGGRQGGTGADRTHRPRMGGGPS